MWIVCFILSVSAVVFSLLIPLFINSLTREKKVSVFHCLFAGVFLAAFFMFLPVYVSVGNPTVADRFNSFFLSIFSSMQIFALEAGFEDISESIANCNGFLAPAYKMWAVILFVLAPIFTFGFVLSLFKNISAYIKYLAAYFRDVYVFTELNEKSIILASDIKSKNRKAAIVFNDVFEDNDEKSYELMAKAKRIGAICFKKDVVVIDYKKHSPSKAIYFFAIGNDETENTTQTLKLIESYNQRDNTHIYVFSTHIDGELLLTACGKGKIKVRRINEVQSLINRVLYEKGHTLFENAVEGEDGIKDISAVVVGMGCHGTEMLKALTWFGQMDGYRIEINAFDKDELAEEKFAFLAPELMSDKYNGVYYPGEAQYKIKVHSGVDVLSQTFADKILSLKKATYVMVSLGSDELNIRTAVNLRMLFERMGIHPVINAIVYNTQQKNALIGIKNYRGQPYDIDFIGDVASSFTKDVIINSELEADGLKRHLLWGKEEEFWTYEYNYKSSIASVIHMKARIKCNIQGADKDESLLTKEERDRIETLEHRRWNAYMRSEGYVFSGSKDKKSRNDLAKMHHDLIDYESLSDEDKRKDSQQLSEFELS